MKKNNKGFTLIELLAALVILGLLVMLGLPRLIDAISNSKDKVYVSDAKRLIAQTEYKVKVNSSVIELPDDGNCIVVGLRYLDASDFDSPPNDGEYMESQSFAVIKNNNGKFEYSARLVEKYKDDKGYKGVELSKSADLDNKGGLMCVKAFKTQDVRTDIMAQDNNTINGYINDEFGMGYCSMVENVYKELDLDDSGAVQTNSNPKIISATITSNADKKDFNSFETIFRLKADDDGGRDKLSVCYSLDGYNDAKNNCVSYNSHVDSNGIFSLDFDMSSGRSYNNEYPPLVVYCIVKDAQGAYSRRDVTYEFHKNQPPVIDKDASYISGISESESGINATLTLNITDDITAIGDLLLCFDEGDTGRCTEPYPAPYTYRNYMAYKDLFGAGNRWDYRVAATDLDGSTHVVKVYAVDEYGAAAEPVPLYYTLEQKEVPDFQGGGTSGSNITLQPIKFKNVTDNSLKVKVSFKVLEKLGSVSTSDIGVKIEELVGSTAKYTNTYNYVNNGSYTYLFGSTNKTTTSYLYDGALRKLKVTVYQKSNPSNENHEIVDYRIHNNTKPKIELKNIYSTGFDACVPGYRCDVYQRNSRDVVYNISVSDDITERKDLKFCVSEDIDDCIPERTYNYFKLPTDGYDDSNEFEYYGSYRFKLNNAPLPYLGQLKNLYIYVMDSYGKYTNTSVPGGYTIYKNQAPFIDLLEIIDNNEVDAATGSIKLKLSPKLYDSQHIMYDTRDHGGTYYFADDLDDNKYLGYEIKLEGKPLQEGPLNEFSSEPNYFKKTVEELKSLSESELANTLTFDKILNNELDVYLDPHAYSYNGSILHFELILTDSYGESSSFNAEYQLYNNKPPVIDKFNVTSANPPCVGCDNSGGYDVNVDLSVSDDLDSSEDLYVCIDEDVENCVDSAYVSYNEFFKNKIYKYTFKGADGLTPYNGEEKKLVVGVKDKNLATTYSEVNYVVYTNVSPEIVGNATVTSQLGTKYNSMAALFNVNVKDDFNDLYEKVCYTYEGSSGEVVYEEMKCDGEFRPYDKNFKFKINYDEYDGQPFFVKAQIMDAYGKTVETPFVRYQISNDVAPTLSDVSGMLSVPGYTNQAVISFKAVDYGDTIRACVLPEGTSSSNCNFNNSPAFDGSTESEHTFIYSYGSNVPNTTSNYVLYIKDKNGNGTLKSKTFKFINYSSSNICASTSVSGIESITYEPRNNSNILNADKCSGRCYYWGREISNGNVIREESDTYNITVPYNKKISYRSKYSELKFCNTTTTVVNLNCGSVECFNTGDATNKNYNNHKVIGLEENITTDTWVYFDEQNIQRIMTPGSRYYKLYTTKYNTGDDYITLEKTQFYIPVEKIDNYSYSSLSSDNYLRALDSKDTKVSKSTSHSVAAKIKLIKDSGDVAVGDRVEIGTDSFRVIKIDSSTNVVTLLANANYYEGAYYEAGSYTPFPMNFLYEDVRLCKQDPDARGVNSLSGRRKGVVGFSVGGYWSSDGHLIPKYGYSYPAYVYENSLDRECYDKIRDMYQTENIRFIRIRYLSYEEAYALGCRTSANSCPSWLRNYTFWLGSAANENDVWYVNYDGSLKKTISYETTGIGARYVIEVNKNEIVKE